MEAALPWPLSFCRPEPLLVRGNRISICLLGLEFVYLFLKSQSDNLLNHSIRIWNSRISVEISCR